jgi:hypothetical protein
MALQIKSFISAARSDEATARAIHGEGFWEVIGKGGLPSAAPLPRHYEAGKRLAAGLR